jgi:hypothetical protein
MYYVYIYIYVYIYVCMYVRTYVCTYVRTLSVYMYVRTNACIYVFCMYVWVNTVYQGVFFFAPDDGISPLTTCSIAMPSLRLVTFPFSMAHTKKYREFGHPRLHMHVCLYISHPWMHMHVHYHVGPVQEHSQVS